MYLQLCVVGMSPSVLPRAWQASSGEGAGVQRTSGSRYNIDIRSVSFCVVLWVRAVSSIRRKPSRKGVAVLFWSVSFTVQREASRGSFRVQRARRVSLPSERWVGLGL